MKGEDAFGTELAASALVRFGAVRKTVTKDDGAFGEGGSNDLSQALGAVGEHKGEFGLGCNAAERGFGAGVEENGADPVAKRSSPGIARCHDRISTSGKVLSEQAKLSRLAGAIKALESDERAGVHRASLLDRA